MRGYFLVTGWGSNMHSLVVQALAMRQLGRLNPRHLLAAGYGPAQPEWCPRTIHTRQLWGCSAYPTLGCHGPALCSRDAVRTWSVHQLRFKSNKKKGAAKPTQEEEEDTESSDSEDEVDEEPNMPKDYKDIEKYVQSFRYDVILRAGLDMARNNMSGEGDSTGIKDLKYCSVHPMTVCLSNSKIEDSFYSNKLRLNGQKLIKKSKTVRVGDTLDLVMSENQDTNTVTLMRVILKKVLGESTNTEKYKVSLRRWKFMTLPKQEAFKP